MTYRNVALRTAKVNEKENKGQTNKKKGQYTRFVFLKGERGGC